MPVYPDPGDPLSPGIFSAVKGWALPGWQAGQAAGRAALLEWEEMAGAIPAVSLECGDW